MKRGNVGRAKKQREHLLCFTPHTHTQHTHTLGYIFTGLDDVLDVLLDVLLDLDDLEHLHERVHHRAVVVAGGGVGRVDAVADARGQAPLDLVEDVVDVSDSVLLLVGETEGTGVRTAATGDGRGADGLLGPG